MPSLENVRAILTTPWGARGYKPRTLRQIESYYVDTALDNDTDPFAIEIGDPEGDLMKVLKRNNEVRIQIFGVDSKGRGTDYLLTGIADEISYDERGVMRFTGRDLSSIAVDSTIPPGQYRRVRAWKVVEKQARQLRIGGRLNLSKTGQVKKAQYTDGSESYWEFWHRLYRKEQMWIWFGPQGYLNAGRLHYDAAPSYFFGKPKSDDSNRIKELYIPVEHAAINKTTQGRIGEVWVYGHKGDNGFLVIAPDPSMQHWLKKPRKIIHDKDVHTRKAAYRVAWEEIFEGKVGSVEISLTIGDPGFLIRQNRMARVRIPEMNLFGDYFVVGTKVQAGPEGFVQEVRLREKDYAISRRVPKDPKLDTGRPRKDTTNQLGVELDVEHANDFIKAAREHHGPWNFALFLATLIAIADQETAFKNVRSYGGPGEDRVEWYKWEAAPGGTRGAGRFPDDPDYPNTGADKDKFGRTHEQWKQMFANEPGQYTGATWAVGFMQLYTLGYKHWADDYMKPGYRNQYGGGRWHIPSNIRAGARALRGKLQSAVRDSGRDIDMWAGVSYYGHHYKGETGTTVPTRYAISVKNKVFNNPGYLQQVTKALEAAQTAIDDAKSNSGTQGDADDSGVPKEFPKSAAACMKILNAFHEPATTNETRNAVRAAALYGYYKRDQINYSHTRSKSDFGPPPNVPNDCDCSYYVIWCYKAALIADPAGFRYGSIGSTYSLDDHGVKVPSVANIKVGDLIFYSNPDHVTIYIGQNKCVSMGSDPGPLIVAINYRPIKQIRRYFGT